MTTKPRDAKTASKKAGPGGPAAPARADDRRGAPYAPPRVPQRPQFQAGIGFWVDPNFIPSNLRAGLVDLMPQHYRDRSTAFFDALGEELQVINVMRSEASPAQVREQIQRIETAAHALLNVLNQFGSESASGVRTLEAHANALAYLSSPPVRLPVSVHAAIRQGRGSKFLASAWDWVAALRIGANYAAAHVKPNKSVKVSKAPARDACRHAARAIHRLFGEFPPSGQHGWFCELMTGLCDHFGMSCGPRVVSDAVKAVRREHDALMPSGS